MRTFFCGKQLDIDYIAADGAAINRKAVIVGSWRDNDLSLVGSALVLRNDRHFVLIFVAIAVFDNKRSAGEVGGRDFNHAVTRKSEHSVFKSCRVVVGRKDKPVRKSGNTAQHH